MAVSIKALRRRLRTVKSTQKVTRAMETVSGVKLRRAQARASASKPYANKLKEMVAALADDEAVASHPLSQRRPVTRRTLIVIAADRGLCGAFNSNVLRQVDQFISEHGAESTEIVAVGKRAQDHSTRRGLTIVDRLVPLGGVADAATAVALARRLSERFTAAKTDEIWVLSTRLRSPIHFEPAFERLLPLDLGETGPPRKGPRLNYIFEPSADAVLGAVLPRTVESRLYLAIAESVAAEHSARRMAMHNATENCAELTTTLTLHINKARQASITKELLEIVGGADALKQ